MEPRGSLCSPPMLAEVAVAVLCAIVGVPAARSIVAEADAHRLDRPDRWWGPTCAVCEAGLGPTLVRCVAEGHRQRTLNLVVLVGVPILFAAVPSSVPSLWVVPAFLLFVGTAVLLTVTDLDTKLIPNRILARGGSLAGVALVVGGLLASLPGSVARGVAGAGAYFGVMLILALLARGALGFGDVKLAAMLGGFTAFLGWGHLVLTGIGAFVLAGITALVLLALRLASRRDHIPFGPFMVAAALVALYVGDLFLDWYLG